MLLKLIDQGCLYTSQAASKRNTGSRFAFDVRNFKFHDVLILMDTVSSEMPNTLRHLRQR